MKEHEYFFGFMSVMQHKGSIAFVFQLTRAGSMTRFGLRLTAYYATELSLVQLIKVS